MFACNTLDIFYRKKFSCVTRRSAVEKYLCRCSQCTLRQAPNKRKLILKLLVFTLTPFVIYVNFELNLKLLGGQVKHITYFHHTKYARL